MNGYRSRIELLHWVRTGNPDPRGALTFYSRLAGLPLDYVEKRARGEVEPDEADLRRIDEVWHAQPSVRHRWRIVLGSSEDIVWRCAECGITLRGTRRTAALMLSPCVEGQLTSRQKELFA